MDLFDNPEFRLTRYVEDVHYDSSEQTLCIRFNRGPDDWCTSHSLLFSNVVTFLSEQQELGNGVDEQDNIDTVVGFDLNGFEYPPRSE